MNFCFCHQKRGSGSVQLLSPAFPVWNCHHHHHELKGLHELRTAEGKRLGNPNKQQSLPSPPGHPLVRLHFCSNYTAPKFLPGLHRVEANQRCESTNRCFTVPVNRESQLTSIRSLWRDNGWALPAPGSVIMTAGKTGWKQGFSVSSWMKSLKISSV